MGAHRHRGILLGNPQTGVNKTGASKRRVNVNTQSEREEGSQEKEG